MKLLFLTIGKRTTPSTRFRVKQYLSRLEKDGVSCDLRHIEHAFFKRFSLLKNIAEYDAVIIQKKLFSPLFLFLLSHKSKCLIYDFDDLVTISTALITGMNDVADNPNGEIKSNFVERRIE